MNPYFQLEISRSLVFMFVLQSIKLFFNSSPLDFCSSALFFYICNNNLYL